MLSRLKRTCGFAAAVAASLAVTGCTYLFPVEEEMLAPPLIEPQKIEFKTVPVTVGDIVNKLQVSASFTPTVYNDVVFPYSGRLLALYVKEGLDVKEGDLLAEFDTESIDNSLRDQRYVVEKAKLNYEQKKSGQSDSNYIYASADGVVTEVHAQAGRDAAALVKAYGGLCAILPEYRLRGQVEHVSTKLNVGQVLEIRYDGATHVGNVTSVTGGAPAPEDKKTPYFWNGTIGFELETQQVPDGARVEITGYKQNAENPAYYEVISVGQADVELVGLTFVSGSGVIEEVLVSPGQTVKKGDPLFTTRLDKLAIETARIDYEAAKAKLADLQLQFDRARVLAPITGRVAWISTLNINDWINSFTDLCRIADPASIMLEYKGDKASQFVIGSAVTVTFKAKEYVAEVTANPSSIPRDKNGAQVNAARFVVKDFDMNTVAYGESASIVSILEEKKNTIVLPKNYVQSFYGRKYINVLVDGAKVEKDVRIGIETATQVEILEGITINDLVIIQ